MKLLAPRRQFLRQAAAVGGYALLAPWSKPASAQRSLSSVRLSDRLVALLGPDSNVVAADSDAGLILVDGGHERWSSTLLEQLDEQFPGRPISALFNTHWHSEQTGSNRALGEQGVEIIAHENTKLWLGTEVWVRWSDRKFPPLPEVAWPTTTFYDSGALQRGGRRVEYGFMLHAHTDGDIWVLFPDENVLVTGGPVSNAGWPIIDWWTGGWIGGMLDGFDALLAVADERTRIVPSNGPVMTLAELRAQHEMYLTIFDRLQTMLREALGTDEVVAARPTAEYDGERGDPTLFVRLAFESMWGHLRDAHDQRMRNIA